MHELEHDTLECPDCCQLRLHFTRRRWSHGALSRRDSPRDTATVRHARVRRRAVLTRPWGRAQVGSCGRLSTIQHRRSEPPRGRHQSRSCVAANREGLARARLGPIFSDERSPSGAVASKPGARTLRTVYAVPASLDPPARAARSRCAGRPCRWTGDQTDHSSTSVEPALLADHLRPSSTMAPLRRQPR